VQREARDSPLENPERPICNKGRIVWVLAARDEEWVLEPRVKLQGIEGINRNPEWKVIGDVWDRSGTTADLCQSQLSG
jgi:hypothetical protein